MVAPGALDRAHGLLLEAHRPTAPLLGVLDVLGPEAETPSTGATQDLMLGRAVPAIYERAWRPFWGAVATGLLGPGTRDQHRIARLLLGLAPGDGVLDLACGTGAFTRDFGRVVGPTGLAIGVDASSTMLARAVADTDPVALPAVGFVRGDALTLPFRDASFDAACCFLALHLMADPLAALDELVRVLVPGGRLALMTTCATRSALLAGLPAAVQAASGMRMFGRDEITGKLLERDLVDVHRRTAGLVQFVGARRPG